MMHVDKSIKLIENAPELLARTLLLKSFLISSGKIKTLRIIKMSKITPIAANKYGISNKLPKENSERAKHTIEIGILLINILSKS